jgi:hypothetical protein
MNNHSARGAHGHFSLWPWPGPAAAGCVYRNRGRWPRSLSSQCGYRARPKEG